MIVNDVSQWDLVLVGQRVRLLKLIQIQSHVHLRDLFALQEKQIKCGRHLRLWPHNSERVLALLEDNWHGLFKQLASCSQILLQSHRLDL